MLKQYQFELRSPGRGIIPVTDNISELVTQAAITTGLCHVFLHHTSASLILCENSDPLVRKDLETFMQRLAPDNNSLYEHQDEGPDDMPSHIRSVLTTNFIIVPITNGRLGLGTWQGIYLWEHRFQSHIRKLTVTVQGE